MENKLTIGSKVTMNMDGIETLHAEITDQRDNEVLVSFWVNIDQFIPA